MAFTWTEPISAGDIIKASHPLEMQTNLDSIVDNILACGTHNSSDDFSKNSVADSADNSSVDITHDLSFYTNNDDSENGTHYGTVYSNNNDTYDSNDLSTNNSSEDTSVTTCSPQYVSIDVAAVAVNYTGNIVGGG